MVSVGCDRKFRKICLSQLAGFVRSAATGNWPGKWPHPLTILLRKFIPRLIFTSSPIGTKLESLYNLTIVFQTLSDFLRQSKIIRKFITGGSHLVLEPQTTVEVLKVPSSSRDISKVICSKGRRKVTRWTTFRGPLDFPRSKSSPRDKIIRTPTAVRCSDQRPLCFQMFYSSTKSLGILQKAM